MDILIHCLSGVSVGIVISSFSGNSRFKLIGFAALGGVLPDLDAISLWSKFDATFGRVLGLNDSGHSIYFSKFWYSHHGFLHSIAASLMFAFIWGLLFFVLQSKSANMGFKGLTASFKKNRLILISFIAGYILHLIEDMPTPNNYWDGVRFFWPSGRYVGGTGEIWWWNNYDIFLIVLASIAVNGLLITLKPFIKVEVKTAAVLVFVISFMACVGQIKTRGYSFNNPRKVSKYQENEAKSLELQEKILGKKLFSIMETFDNNINVNF